MEQQLSELLRKTAPLAVPQMSSAQQAEKTWLERYIDERIREHEERIVCVN